MWVQFPPPLCARRIMVLCDLAMVETRVQFSPGAFRHRSISGDALGLYPREVSSNLTGGLSPPSSSGKALVSYTRDGSSILPGGFLDGWRSLADRTSLLNWHSDRKSGSWVQIPLRPLIRRSWDLLSDAALVLWETHCPGKTENRVRSPKAA